MWFFGPKSKKCYCDGTPPSCTSNLIYIRVGKCRSPKSSNRIELSWLVLLLFTGLGPPLCLSRLSFFFCCHSLLVVIIQSDLSQSSESMWVLTLTMRSLHHILQSLHWRRYMVAVVVVCVLLTHFCFNVRLFSQVCFYLFYCEVILRKMCFIFEIYKKNYVCLSQSKLPFGYVCARILCLECNLWLLFCKLFSITPSRPSPLRAGLWSCGSSCSNPESTVPVFSIIVTA